MSINMSYCRFNNTVLALEECLEAMQDSETMNNISESENKQYKKLLELCCQITFEYENGTFQHD